MKMLRPAVYCVYRNALSPDSLIAASNIFNNLQTVSRSLQVAERKQIGLAVALGISWLSSSFLISEDVRV